MSFLEFFDGAYVINLPHRTDRRKEMVKELGKSRYALYFCFAICTPFQGKCRHFLPEIILLNVC